MHSNRIPLAGLPNTRDLGGFPVRGGRAVRPHRLIRSGMLATAADDALVRLTGEYALRTVVDFRTDEERAEHPDPTPPGVEYVVNPILKKLTVGITREEQGRTPIQRLIRSIHSSGMTAVQFMAGLYRSMALDEYAQRQYARFFSILLEAREGATLWHCTVGKDRVGVGTAMLLLALGADGEDVVEDYLATQIYCAEAIEQSVADAMRSLDDPTAADTVRALNGVHPSYIGTALEAMREQCGSVERYLSERIGLTEERRARLMELYLA